MTRVTIDFCHSALDWLILRFCDRAERLASFKISHAVQPQLTLFKTINRHCCKSKSDRIDAKCFAFRNRK